MNILITGIHGFIGSNLVAVLKKQHAIYGLDLVSPQKDGVEIAIPKKRDRLFRFATFATFGWHELNQPS
jgi:nucleoside-diphosphate-sugar epimerase